MRALLFVLLLLFQTSVLFVFGQPPICECGFIKVWEGAVESAGNSQHILDWYTPSHIIHGLIFFGLLSILLPKQSLSTRFLIAMTLEVSWEILENTPWVIELYRSQALAQGYVGDSILNSLSDTLAAAGGFVLAWRLPIVLVILLALSFELFTGFFIRDNLTLNMLGFVHTFESIHAWQSSL